MSFLNNILQKNLNPSEALAQPRLPGLFEPAAPANEPALRLGDKPGWLVEPQPEQRVESETTSQFPAKAQQFDAGIPARERDPTEINFRPLTPPSPSLQRPAPLDTETLPDPSPISATQNQENPQPTVLTEETPVPARPTGAKDRPAVNQLESPPVTSPLEPLESIEPARPLSPKAVGHNPPQMSSLPVKTVRLALAEPDESLSPRLAENPAGQVTEDTPPQHVVTLQESHRWPDMDRSPVEPILVETEAAPISREPEPLPPFRTPPRQLSAFQITPAIRARMPEPPQATPVEPSPAPTINVRIGRIEVKATPPAEPKPKRAKRTSTPVMSLDEYLRQRSRGGGR